MGEAEVNALEKEITQANVTYSAVGFKSLQSGDSLCTPQSNLKPLLRVMFGCAHGHIAAVGNPEHWTPPNVSSCENDLDVV